MKVIYFDDFVILGEIFQWFMWNILEFMLYPIFLNIWNPQKA